MSIFSDVNDMGKLNDAVIERYYNLSYDYVKGESIKHKLSLKTDAIKSIGEGIQLRENSYYHPKWVFETLLASTLSDARHNAMVKCGKSPIITLSKLDRANMSHRFKRLISECGTLEYKGDTFIAMPYYDVSIDSLRCEILTMMYQYITKETQNSKYFKR